MVAVFSRIAAREKEIELGADVLGAAAPRKIFDVWRQRDAGQASGSFKVRLSPNGAGLFIIRQ